MVLLYILGADTCKNVTLNIVKKAIRPRPWFCFPILNHGQRFRILVSKVELEMIPCIDDY